MKPGGGKQKGAAFERQVCEKLSRWVSAGASESCFWRSAMSGGRATVRFAKGKSADNHGGDLTATAEAGWPLINAFCIECKHVADLNLKAALVNGNGPLREYWDQVAGDAQRVGKTPLLIAQQNRLPTMVFTWTTIAPKYFGAVSQIERGRFFRLEGHRISMFGLDDLLELYPYDADRFR